MKTKPFKASTQVPTAILKDKRLSAKATAIFLHAIMFGKIDTIAIRCRFNIGKGSMRNGLFELVNFGYVRLLPVSAAKKGQPRWEIVVPISEDWA